MILKASLGATALACTLALSPALDSAPPAPARGASCLLQDQDDKKKVPAYVGEKECKMCHFKQHKSWKKTSMAMAFDILKPGQRAEVKKKFKLDPEKDYTKDPACLVCHTVGYGKPGGYPAILADKPWKEKETKLAATREGVQCESCHGPSKLLLPVKKELKKSKREYTTTELSALGLVIPDKDNCTSCHNDKSPTYDKDKKFDYKKATADKKKIHDHVPLKQKKKEEK